jgi:hypothetical protein
MREFLLRKQREGSNFNLVKGSPFTIVGGLEGYRRSGKWPTSGELHRREQAKK